jgi:hypothetical protein
LGKNHGDRRDLQEGVKMMVNVGKPAGEMSRYDWKSWATYSAIFVVSALIPELIKLLPQLHGMLPVLDTFEPLVVSALASIGVMLKKYLTDNSNIFMELK